MHTYMLKEQTDLENKAKMELEKAAKAAISKLLEDCFLYQSTKAEISKCKPSKLPQKSFNAIVRKVEQAFLLPLPSNVNPSDTLGNPSIVPETINVRCEYCKGEITPHNPICDVQLFNSLTTKPSEEAVRDQTMVFSYQCQKCKHGELVFLVRRVGLKFWLAGRSQLDNGPLVSWVSNKHRKLFSDARVAFRTNNHLASICLLRIAIERFLRDSTKTKEQCSGDDLWRHFLASMPESFPRDHIPSLGVVYERLSRIMHGGGEDPEKAFPECWAGVVRFFNCLRHQQYA